MNKMFKVAFREYQESVRRKAFIIGVIVTPVLLLGGLLVLELLRDRQESRDRKIILVDNSGKLAQPLLDLVQKHNENRSADSQGGDKIRPAILFSQENPLPDSTAQELELCDKIRNKAINGFLIIGKDVLHPQEPGSSGQITYHSENPLFDDMRPWLSGSINDLLQTLRLQEAGIDATQVKPLLVPLEVEARGLITWDEKNGKVISDKSTNKVTAFGVPFIMVILMWTMIMLGAMPLVNSTLEEKNQRIYEILLGSARPFDLMMGKLLGSFGVSLTAAVTYIIGGIVVAKVLHVTQYIPFHLLPWFFAYLVGAILMIGSLHIAVGAACNDAKETQSLMTPLMLPIALPMFLVIPVIQNPLSDFATILSFFPTATPVLMLLRQATPASIPAWQPWVGLLELLLFTWLFVWIGGRIFRVGLLIQGTTPKFRDLIRWVYWLFSWKKTPGRRLSGRRSG